MKRTFNLLATAILMASLTLTSCSSGSGKGDQRDRNLEYALTTRLDSIHDVQYVGMSDVHVMDHNRLQAVIIFYVTDSTGNKIERNTRVTANDDCSEFYTWEDVNSTVLEDTKQAVAAKFKEKGLNIDGSLIDTLIELKRHSLRR